MSNYLNDTSNAGHNSIDQDPTDSALPSYESPWSSYPGSSVQQWSEHPTLVRGSFAGGRLKPVKNERGEIDELEWDPLVKQDQDLRVKASTKRAKKLVEPSIMIESEAEYFDLVGDPLSFTHDTRLLSGLHTALPEIPLHPTIYLNTHFASHPPPSTSRIMTTLEPSYLNRGNCIALSDIDMGEGTSTQGLVWRMGDERYKRPSSVGWGVLNRTSTGSRKGKEKATDQDALLSGFHSSSTSPRVFSHHTPIHQLSLVPLSPYHTLLAVRSHTSLDLVHLALPTPFDPGKPSPLALSRYTYSLPHSQIADFAFGGIASGYGQVGSGLLVDTSGSLYGFGLTPETRLKGPAHLSQPQPELFHLRKGLKEVQRGYSGFARVVYGGKKDSAIVAVEDQVLLYDLRSPTSSLELVGAEILSRYSPQASVVTSLLERSQDREGRSTSIHTVCTNREVLWVDERMTGRRGCEVLRWNHERVGVEGKGFDRTLSILEFPELDHNPHTAASKLQRIALHSRQTPQITIFTTSLTPSSAPQSLLDPYDLPSDAPSMRKDKFNRVGLSISAIREPKIQEESEGEEEEREDGTEEEKRKRRFLRRMVREQERERGRKKGWRLVEVGMKGEVYEREILEGDREGEEEERVDDLEETRQYGTELREESEIETVRLDMTAVIEALGEDQLVGENAEGKGRERGGDRGVEMLKKVVDESREIEGDVGALTAYELLEFARSVDPIQTPQSDSEQEDAQMLDRSSSTPGIESLPRPTSFVPDKANPLLSSSLSPRLPRLDSLVSSFSHCAANSLRPFDTSPPSRFNAFAPFPFSLQSTIAERANHLRRTFNIDDSPSNPSSLACDQVAADLTLSSTIFLPRTIEPDEPTDTPNQPQPATEDPPSLHLSYLRPIVSDLNYSDDDSEPALSYNSRRNQKKKPTLNGKGARLLLAEWHIGSDPRSYTWSNPYQGEKLAKEDGGFSQSQSQTQRKKNRKKRGGNEDSQLFGASSQPPAFSQSQPSRFEFPSSFPSTSQSYFPSLGAPPQPPPSSSQSQDWNQAASTQPIISITGPGNETQTRSQGVGAWGGAASQIVPGAFGARQIVGSKKEKEKKKTKKRVSGF